jgi:hypothetical protein
MTQRRALPTEFRFRDLAENTATHGEQLAVRDSAFAAAMRERRPELFADDDVVFAEGGPGSSGHDAPVSDVGAAAIVVEDEVALTFGGIAAPPSHDFPV